MGGPHVLVIEDVDDTRDHIAKVLRAHGYSTENAKDGLDALKKVSAVPFDAIVLDLVMPQVDGWQFRQTQLRHPELAGIPTVIVSVRPLREPDRFALRAADVIQKPFRDSALLNAVADACRTPQAVVAAQLPSPDKLFWSRRGEVACWTHAPRNDSVRWHQEQWTALPDRAPKHRVVYQCQHCPGHGGPVGHRTRASNDASSADEAG